MGRTDGSGGEDEDGMETEWDGRGMEWGGDRDEDGAGDGMCTRTRME